MTAEQLKNSILQEAFSGSLTHDDLSEWEYVTLGDICNFGKCESVDVKDIPNDAWVLELEDIEKDTARILKRLTLRERKIKGTRHKFQKGQLLYSKLRTYLNKVLVAPADGYCTGEIVPITFKEGISVEYMCHFMRSPFVLQYTASCGYGIKMPRVNPKQMNGIEVPLPPLAEQKRIVAKLEELLPIVEQYGKAQKELDELNAALPARLRQSILQEAISGRLVPQDEKEGTAEELLKRIDAEKQRLIKVGKLKNEKASSPITEDEIPFEIPSSWKWVSHNYLFNISGGTQPPKSEFVYEPREGYIRLYQIRDYGKTPQPVYIPYKKTLKISKEGDILLARYGASLGKVFFAKDGAYNVAIARVIPQYESELINTKYIYWYYKSSIYQHHITDRSRCAQAGFNKDDLNNLYFPLPPLAEQQRIVAKIEELFAEIDKLVK